MVKNILFDFDGVILDSMVVRRDGFRKIFKEYSGCLVDKLLEYHDINGGLSRYVKIRYFYEELLKEHITENKINALAEKFSIIMKKELVEERYLIRETLDFLKSNNDEYNFHIVSGSDEKELKYLCEKLGIDDLFVSIHGSPVHKNTLVNDVLSIYGYNKEETILIGDSVNDYEASVVNGICFYGYNNDKLKIYNYISTMNRLPLILSEESMLS